MASENQASPSKPRSMLPRTLVVILSPISDVPTTNLRRFSSKKLEKVFEDFKQCNKQSISVQLQDAVDDIQFVGCLSPFTLLIHGSTEDMDTIEHAWVGRMLKPPSGFLIKDFGEISEVKMKQILQSQFISISDTLCEIVKGLNECQIASTFECVVSRLCSSFDSVVIPPMTAIKKSLDLLVEDKRLTFINALYNYGAPLKLTKETPTVKHQAPEIETPGPQKIAYLTKKKATEGKRYVRREHSPKEHNLKSQNGKEKERALKTKKMKYSSGKFTEKTQREARLDNNLRFSRKATRNGRRNEIVKSNSLKIRRPNHCIPRRQCSYEELPSHAAHDEIDSKKPNKKRNSFIGKLSRLFKIEDGKHTSNDETEDDDYDYDICDKEWDKIVSNEQAKLLSSKTETKQQNALIKENKNGVKTKGKKERGFSSNKQLDRKRFSENSAKVSRDKNKNEGESRLEGYSRKYSSRLSKTSTNASSRSRSPDWLNANFSRDNKSTVAVRQNTKWKTSQKKEHEMKRTNEQQPSPRKDSFSSISDSNYSFESDLDYSLSSDSSVDIKRKSFHYSDDDTTDEESQLGSWEDGSSKFSSTRAICGDLEMNTLSLNPSNKTTSSSDSTKPVENHSTTTSLYGNKTSDQNIFQQNKLHGRNLVQFIGIL